LGLGAFAALAGSSCWEEFISVASVPRDVGSTFEQFGIGGHAGFDFGSAEVKFLIVGPVEVNSGTSSFATTTGGFQLEDWVAGDAVQVSARRSLGKQIFEHFADGPHPEQSALIGQDWHVTNKRWFLLETIRVMRVSDNSHLGSLGLTDLVYQD
jgi:hypothetical protein